MKTKRIVLFLLYFLFLLGQLVITGYSLTDKPSSLISQPEVRPCLTINQVHIEGLNLFKNIAPNRVAQWRQRIEGQCANDRVLMDYAEYVTAELEQAGYSTSYLFYPEQTLLFGILKAEIIAGTISSITYQDTERGHRSLSSAFPLVAGQVLNLRHVEQGLDNLQNTALIPYQIYLIRDVDGKNGTRLVVDRQGKRSFKGLLTIGAQNSAGQPTNMANNILMLANPLLLNDFLYIDISSDLDIEPAKKLKSAAFFYSIPYQYGLFSIYGGYQDGRDVSTINNIDLKMRQRSHILLLQAKYRFRRAQNSVTSVGIGSQVQTVDTFLAYRHLKTQSRLASYFITELNHQIDFPRGNATFSLVYKQGTSWFGDNSKTMTGLDKSPIYQLSFDAFRSFLWGKQATYFQHHTNIQMSRSKLDSLLEQDAFIGKSGVSGFGNGDQNYRMGDNSLKVKSEWGWLTPWKGQLYSALDIGATSNDRATFWKEQYLVGARIGAKGQQGSFAYHLFLDVPIWQATDATSHNFNSGITLSVNY